MSQEHFGEDRKGMKKKEIKLAKYTVLGRLAGSKGDCLAANQLVGSEAVQMRRLSLFHVASIEGLRSLLSGCRR